MKAERIADWQKAANNAQSVIPQSPSPSATRSLGEHRDDLRRLDRIRECE